MKNQTFKRKWAIPFAVIFAAVCVVGGVVLSAKRQEPRKQLQTKHPKDWLASVPPVLSKVKNLEIINARVIGAGTDMAGVAFEIVNKSQRPVIAVRITCGSGGVTNYGFDDESNPVVVIEPNGVLPAIMRGELTENAPIVISAATFADGSEEGDHVSVEVMHSMREHSKAREKAEKQQSSAGRRPPQ